MRIWAIITVLSLSPLAFAQTAPTSFNTGQKVQVREGDQWSSATILKKEGRRYQIKYDGADGTEEWVTIDRLRAPGAAGAASAPAAAPATPDDTAPAGAPSPKLKPPPNVKAGDKVQVKWGGLWRDATVKNKGNGWVLINYAPGAFFEWVEPWRIRLPGDKDDTLPSTSPRQTLTKPEPPPTDKPGPRPEAEERGRSHAEADSTIDEKAPMKPADLSAATPVVIGAAPAGAGITPDAALLPKTLSPQPVVLRGAFGEFFEHSDLLLPAASTGSAIVFNNNEPPGVKAQGRIERVDLVTGRETEAIDLPTAVKVLDVSADAKFILSRSTGHGFGAESRLDLWSLDDSPLAHVISFQPYSDRSNASRDIAWAAFLSPQRVATVNGDGRLVVWDVQNAKALWSGDIKSHATPAVSANGKYLAVAVQQDVALLDSTSGKTLAVFPAERDLFTSRLSFRPDGKQLALATSDWVRVWDTTTGKVVGDAYPVSLSTVDVGWPADGYLLLGGKSLIDLAKGVVIWSYNRGGASHNADTATFGGRMYYIVKDVGEKTKPVLASVVLPDDVAKKAAQSLNPDEVFAVKPGTKISLKVNNLPESQDNAVESLKQKLKANGIEVADGQPIQLVATIETGKTSEISYHKFGDPPFGGGTKVSVTEQISKIDFIDAEGKSLWHRQTQTFPPMMLNLKKDQSIEQAVQEAMQPRTQFFLSVQLPPRVPKAQYKDGLGNSTLTPRGVQPGAVAEGVKK